MSRSTTSAAAPRLLARVLPAILAVHFTAFCSAAVAQPMWTLQTPQPAGVNLNGVALVSGMDGWIVGEQGAILHTVDGGWDPVAWRDESSPAAEYPIHGVSFSSALRGCAVGNGIRFTTNGGTTWAAGSGGSYGTLEAVDLLNDNLGWACGNGGRIIHTTNGGASWVNQVVPTTTTLWAIDFVDASRGWAVGSTGTILATTNGGATWNLQPSGTTAWLFGVSIVSAAEGWACGGNVVLHTTNGGASWTPQAIPAGISVGDIQFVNASQGWAVGANLAIIRTMNGGADWSLVFGGITGDDYYRHALNDVHFADAMHGMAVGGGGAIYTSVNGGLTWSPAQNGSERAGRVFALDAQRAWTDGIVCYTENGGRTWTRTAEDATDVVFSDSLNGWSCRFGGVPPLIRRTTDGGRSWVPVPGDPVHPWKAIDTEDGVTIVVVGWDGNFARLARSGDGGQTWFDFPPGTFAGPILNDVDMVTPTVGYAVGHGPVIYKTTNGGLAWVRQSTGTASGGIQSVSFSDVNNGWCVGGLYNTQLTEIIALHTTNGGQTWTEQPIRNDAAGMWSVSAVNANVAWVGGVEGFLARTTNGGQTWVREMTGLDPFQYFGVTFLDAENGWASSGGQIAVGSNRGGVFRRSGGSVTAVDDPSPGLRFPPSGLEVMPNPFAAGTRLRFALAGPATVSLVVYDASGRRVSRLLDRVPLATGAHESLLLADDRSAGRGAALASGIYFARLFVDGRSQGTAQRLVLMR